MKVLVLGATSAIGSDVAAEFSRGNHLLLVGRDPNRLREAADLCREFGAETVIEMPCDLRTQTPEAIRAAANWQPDVIVNSASATSRLRDNAIRFEDLPGYITVDLSGPLELIRSVGQGHRSVSVVFVSSMLAAVRTPRGSIYSSLKLLQEQALRRLEESGPNRHVLIVRIARIISPDRRGPQTRRLAQRVRKAFEARKRTVYYGTMGRLVTALFYLQPALFNLGIRIVRMVRGGTRS